jgi:hypothetical protein
MQLELMAPAVDELVARVSETGILPKADETAHLTKDELTLLGQAWMRGMAKNADRIADAQRAAFASRGWPFQWFSTWRPVTAADRKLSLGLDEAIDVAEQYYPAIAARGLGHAEDMGILQSKGRGSSEGIQMKRDPYGTLILISVYAVTGPSNFDPVEGSVQFEPGSASHVFHLVYDSLPTLERLCGDLAGYPLIKAECNRQTRKSGSKWMSEGWVSKQSDDYRSRPVLHRPWDTITKESIPAAL